MDFGLLLVKLSSIGFGIRVIQWCSSYLSDRTFSVIINSSISSIGCCTSGVVHDS